MMSEFARGFSYAWSGLSALPTPGLRRFVLLPVLISVVVFASIISAGVVGFGILVDWLLAWLPAWLDWLQWVLWPVFAVVALLVAVYTFTVLANLLGAPFNSVLAARYERLLTGQLPAAGNRGFWQEVTTAFVHELAKLWYLLRWLVPAALLFLVPGLNLLAPLIWLGLGAWLLALEYMDYPMENHALTTSDQRAALAARRGMTLGLGAGVMLLASLPVVNLLAMPAGVLGATRMWCEEFREAPQ